MAAADPATDGLAGAILHDYGLLPFSRQPVGDGSGDPVVGATGSKGNHDTHIARWEILRRCRGGDRWGRWFVTEAITPWPDDHGGGPALAIASPDRLWLEDALGVRWTFGL